MAGVSGAEAGRDCFHCGLPVPAGSRYDVTIDGQVRTMCCAGCQAVAQAIVDNNLLDFYRLRTRDSQRAAALVPEELKQLQVYDSGLMQRSFVRHHDQDVREAALILEGIVCAACVWLNEHHVQQLPGVLAFRVNYSTHRATLQWDNRRIQLSEVLAAIAAIGYRAHPFDPGRMESLQQREKSAALRRIAVAGLGMMQVMMMAAALYIGAASDMEAGMRQFLRWISLIMVTPVVFYADWPFFQAAWRDLRRLRPGMDVPVALALGAAYLASVWATVSGVGEVYFDSVSMFSFFLLSGRYLEMQARHKAGQVAEALVKLLPASANRIRNGQQEVVAVAELEPGDQVLVKPGETIPADGEVLEGAGPVNEALLTGESLPRLKQPGDRLVGGTLNMSSPLLLQLDRVGADTVLAGITRLLDRAQAEKPALARLADRVASWFVLFILLLAAAVYGWWHFHDPEQAFWITLSVLVVTCPCALSLATPAAITVATGRLTGLGVLTTRGHALETLARVDQLVFDKTGTLTHGELVVADLQVAKGQEPLQCRNLAAGLEQASEHPLARALLAFGPEPLPLTDLMSQPGQGVEGRYQGQRVRLGTRDFVAALAGDGMALAADAADFPGATAVFLGTGQQWLAVFHLRDRVRDEADAVVRELGKMGVKVHLLSGDNEGAVAHLAGMLHIRSFQARQLPDTKLAFVRTLQEQGAVVAMVGDGVNDAPVLAQAQVSLAMGQGAQLAQASADMILLSENLALLPVSVRLARRMQAVIRQNLFWALGYNLLAIPLAASGMLPPWMAALGMSASSLLVVANALRLRNG